MKTFQEFKIKVQENFKIVEYEKDNRLDLIPAFNTALYSIGWDDHNHLLSDSEMALENIFFEKQSLLGLLVKIIPITETLFPNENLQMIESYGEKETLDLIKNATSENWQQNEYIYQVLQSENPQIGILLKDLHFIPRFEMKTNTFPLAKCSLWEGLYSLFLVSHGIVSGMNNNELYLKYLLEAENFYPDSLVIKRNKIKVLWAEKDFDQAQEIAKLLPRKDAKILWLLWKMTNDDHYRNEIIEKYHPKILDFLNIHDWQTKMVIKDPNPIMMEENW